MLAQYLAERFGSCVNVTVVDVNERSIQSAEARMSRRGRPPNLFLVAGDASELSKQGALGAVDLVIGLHACGGLSDLIMAQAIAQGASFAVCTCCFMSHRQLQVPSIAPGGMTYLAREQWLGIDSHSQGKEGPQQDPTQVVCTEDTFSEVLRSAERQHDPLVATTGAHTLNAIRAAAAERHSRGALAVELITFEPKYSPRNFIVVGRSNYTS